MLVHAHGIIRHRTLYWVAHDDEQAHARAHARRARWCAVLHARREEVEVVRALLHDREPVDIIGRIQCGHAPPIRPEPFGEKVRQHRVRVVEEARLAVGNTHSGVDGHLEPVTQRGGPSLGGADTNNARQAASRAIAPRGRAPRHARVGRLVPVALAPPPRSCRPAAASHTARRIRGEERLSAWQAALV